MKAAPSILALAILTFSACKPESVEDQTEAGPKDGEVYRLQVGDVIEMEVFQEPDLYMRSTIDQMGHVSFALIGEVEAKGHSVAELEEILKEQYAKDYLLDPWIKVTLSEKGHDQSSAPDELTAAKLRFEEIKGRYLTKHPKYLAAKRRLEELENREQK